MPIIKPECINVYNTTFVAIIFGAPGIGKSTLGLSAPKPLHIDYDRSVYRVKGYHRKDTIEPESYEEVLQDLKSPEMANYETIVVDTGGSFVTYLQDWAIKQNPSVNANKSGQLSLKGFGVVKAEFKRFINYVRDILKKNLIFIFHSEEQKDKDGNVQQRLLAEGSAKNLVWQPCDLGGYMEMVGDQRVIHFTPTSEYFAKGSFGIEGTYNIPKLSPTDSNDFLTKLFAVAKQNIEAEAQMENPDKKQYEAVMRTTKDYLDHVTTVKELNTVKDAVANMKHALTSKKECGAMLNSKAKELGCILDKATKQYVQKA